MRKKLVRFTCDRCKSVVSEEVGEDADDTTPEPALTITGVLLGDVDQEKIEYHDLCDKCRDRLVSLVQAIMKGGKGKTKSKKKTTTKKNTDKAPKNASAAA